MKLTQIRNATLVLEYADKKFLIDPMLAEKGAFPAFPDTVNQHLRNPTVSLPVPVEALVDADAVIITHTHIDHWDEAAARALPASVPVFVQHEGDARLLRESGFIRVEIMSEETVFEGVTLSKTGGQHGSDEAYSVPELAAGLGEVSGVVVRAEDEKTVYIAGDTVWNNHVISALNTYAPDVVVINAGFAQEPTFGGIIMGKDDVRRVHEVLPGAMIVATHLEAVNHCILSRKELRDYIAELDLQSIAFVPEDGESYQF